MSVPLLCQSSKKLRLNGNIKQMGLEINRIHNAGNFFWWSSSRCQAVSFLFKDLSTAIAAQ